MPDRFLQYQLWLLASSTQIRSSVEHSILERIETFASARRRLRLLREERAAACTAVDRAPRTNRTLRPIYPFLHKSAGAAAPPYAVRIHWEQGLVSFVHGYARLPFREAGSFRTASFYKGSGARSQTIER